MYSIIFGKQLRALGNMETVWKHLLTVWGGGGGRKRPNNMTVLKSYACALQPPALPLPTSPIYMAKKCFYFQVQLTRLLTQPFHPLCPHNTPNILQ